ncbi:hypothetical protein [Paenibacillus sp. RC84]|uniref:hypothetical protein n=1 Tax=Paenibacillus sp. RC84 TaxID=3156252 RepID=UPI003513EC14
MANALPPCPVCALADWLTFLAFFKHFHMDGVAGQRVSGVCFGDGGLEDLDDQKLVFAHFIGIGFGFRMNRRMRPPYPVSYP